MNRSWIVTLGGLVVGCSDFAATTDGAGGQAPGSTTVSTVTSSSSAVEAASQTIASSSSTGVVVPPVTVHVVDTEGTPVADVIVFANDAEGNLVDETLSDAAGDASLEVQTGGSVHVAREASYFNAGQLFYARDINSQFGVAEGADVTFRVMKAGTSTQAMENAPMRLTAFAYTIAGMPPEVETANIVMSCQGDFYTSLGYRILDDYRGCAGEDTFSLFAIGYDENNRLVGAGALRDLPFESGSDATHQVQMHAVSAAPTTVTLTAASEPDQRLQIAIAGDADHFEWFEEAVEDNVATLSLTSPVPDLFDRYYVLATARNATGQRGFARWSHTAGVPPQGVDVDARDLAAVRVASYDKRDPQHPSMTLALAPGPLGDYLDARLYWGDSDRTISWRGVAAPGSRVAMRVPTLPEAVADWVIQPGETMGQLWAYHTDTEVTSSALDAFAIDASSSTRMYTYASDE